MLFSNNITNIAWETITRDRHIERMLVFRNIKYLFFHVMCSIKSKLVQHHPSSS